MVSILKSKGTLLVPERKQPACSLSSLNTPITDSQPAQVILTCLPRAWHLPGTSWVECSTSVFPWCCSDLQFPPPWLTHPCIHSLSVFWRFTITSIQWLSPPCLVLYIIMDLFLFIHLFCNFIETLGGRKVLPIGLSLHLESDRTFFCYVLNKYDI